MEKTTISIYGSCCTRDALRYYEGNKLELLLYIARTSLYSNLDIDNPWNIKENELNLSSSFQKHMIAMDMNKTVYKELENASSDYLLIDFIDERYDTVLCEGKLAAYTSEIINSKFFNDKKYVRLKKSIVDNTLVINGESYNNYIDEFINIILKNYNSKQIILTALICKMIIGI